MQQKRLLLALILSSAILFLWSYFYPAPPPTKQNAGATPSPTASATASQTATSTTPTATPAPLPTPNVNAAPQRTLTIRTPLYDAKFDTLGAEPISWIIKKNKNSQAEIYSVAGHKRDKIPLELISPDGLKRQPRMVPLQLQTGDSAFDAVLSSTTYRIEGVDSSSGDIDINLAPGEKKEITFVLEDSNRVQVRKKFVFDAERYETDLSVRLKRGDETIPQVKVAIGPSIGDQGVSHHTFYSVAPEAVAYVGDKLQRHLAAGINGNSSSPDRLVLNGSIDWAGVGDTYFAMVAVPARRTDGLEYRTVAYEHKHNGGAPEKRYLISAFVPVPSDGSRTIIYSGPKDHYLLTQSSREISALVERPAGQSIDLEALIDYGFLGWLSRPLAV